MLAKHTIQLLTPLFLLTENAYVEKKIEIKGLPIYPVRHLTKDSLS